MACSDRRTIIEHRARVPVDPSDNAMHEAGIPAAPLNERRDLNLNLLRRIEACKKELINRTSIKKKVDSTCNASREHSRVVRCNEIGDNSDSKIYATQRAHPFHS